MILEWRRFRRINTGAFVAMVFLVKIYERTRWKNLRLADNNFLCRATWVCKAFGAAISIDSSAYNQSMYRGRVLNCP